MKHAKPAVEEELIGSVLNATETADFNQVPVNLVPNYNIFPLAVDVKDNETAEVTEKTHVKRKKTNQNQEENQNQRNNRRRISSPSNFDSLKPENDSSSDNCSTTLESNYTDVFSMEISTKMPFGHHRHHHHHKHRTTTRNYADFEVTTQGFHSRRQSVNGDELESKVTTQKVRHTILY